MSSRSARQSLSLSRKEQRRATREARRRHRRFKSIALAGGAAVLVALFAFYAVNSAANQPGEPVPDMGNLHIEQGQKSPVAYNSTPPTSGPHYESVARWGVHTEPIPNELVVHNLEDGGVGVWYNCPDGCPELVTQLESVVDGYHEGVLLAPYPGMESRIALTAWTRIDAFNEFDQDRIARFIRTFRGEDHHVASR